VLIDWSFQTDRINEHKYVLDHPGCSFVATFSLKIWDNVFKAHLVCIFLL